MSDLVPTSQFNQEVKVIKLMNGDEIIGVVRQSDNCTQVLYPAKIETAYTKDEKKNLVEYVKLTNYAINLKEGFIQLSPAAIMFIGNPMHELEKMYEIFYITMQQNPNALITNKSDDIPIGPEAGLQLLNELFNNDDFVSFVNELIDTYEGIEIVDDSGDDNESYEGNGETEELLLEPPIGDSSSEDVQKAPAQDKRAKMAPESQEMPFNPEGSPESAESWSDNPEDYI